MSSEHLQSIKMQMADDTEPSVTFRNVHQLNHPDGRVILFEVPAAPLGLPIAWKGHYYARAGESLVSLGLDKQDEIRRQTHGADWSAQIVPDATMEDLHPKAILRARESFARKHSSRFSTKEVLQWPLETFLNRARLTHNGSITRTTIILPENELAAIELPKYDQRIVLEGLHNCIAHQDYTLRGRIIITEKIDRLEFENSGSFFEGKPEDYIAGDKTPRSYRNPFLAGAMSELNMIDTMGYGIHSIHIGQAKRFFPMPDYDLGESNAVRMTLHGRVVDLAYTRTLIRETNLPLEEILALDRVQKRLPLPDSMVGKLRRKGLIEGRRPNLHVSASVAKASSDEADYIRTRAQDNDYYCKLITDYLEKFEKASRKEIDNLLLDKLSDALEADQKSRKISNLLTGLRNDGTIMNTGSKKMPSWELTGGIAE